MKKDSITIPYDEEKLAALSIRVTTDARSSIRIFP